MSRSCRSGLRGLLFLTDADARPQVDARPRNRCDHVAPLRFDERRHFVGIVIDDDLKGLLPILNLDKVNSEQGGN